MNFHMTALIMMVADFVHGQRPIRPYFWKPNLGRGLNVATTEYHKLAAAPVFSNFGNGQAVLIDGYHVSLTVVALAVAYQQHVKQIPHLSPYRAAFWTNVYRWMLRHISMFPLWLGSSDQTYPSTHQVWQRRYHYQNQFIPKWLQKYIFWVPDKDFVKEKNNHRRWLKYSEPAFGKYYRWPGKKFRDYATFNQVETMENLDDASIDVRIRG